MSRLLLLAFPFLVVSGCRGTYAPAVRVDGVLTRTQHQRVDERASRSTQRWRGAVLARAVWSPVHRPLEVVDPPRVRRRAHVPRRIPCRDAALCAWERSQVVAVLGADRGAGR